MILKAGITAFLPRIDAIINQGLEFPNFLNYR